MPKREHKCIDLSVDAVVLARAESGQISVLLIKRKNDPFKGQWAIPGGFVEYEEPLESAAIRELKEETGLELNSMEQLYAFGAPKRDPRKRVVSVAHFALVEEQLPVKGADDATEAAWFNIRQLPELAFDHRQILQMALKRIEKAG